MSYDETIWMAAVTLSNEQWREFERTVCEPVSTAQEWEELSCGTLE
jgi:hypothetical protein